MTSSNLDDLLTAPSPTSPDRVAWVVTGVQGGVGLHHRISRERIQSHLEQNLTHSQGSLKGRFS